MAQALDTRGGTSRALFKIILMLGLVLAGVAALAAEPEPAAAPSAGCAKTTFEFGGRVIQNGEPTDTWTLTCERAPVPEAPATTSSASPVATFPVATVPPSRTNAAQGNARF